MSKKPFKKTAVGKFLWNAGDTLKGKNKVGKVLDGILEIAPIPNPIRIAKDITNQKKLKAIKDNTDVQNAALNNGFNFDDLIENGPAWTQPMLAAITLIGVLLLIGMGVIEPGFLINIIRAVFGM